MPSSDFSYLNHLLGDLITIDLSSMCIYLLTCFILLLLSFTGDYSGRTVAAMNEAVLRRSLIWTYSLHGITVASGVGSSVRQPPPPLCAPRVGRTGQDEVRCEVTLKETSSAEVGGIGRHGAL